MTNADIAIDSPAHRMAWLRAPPRFHLRSSVKGERAHKCDDPRGLQEGHFLLLSHPRYRAESDRSLRIAGLSLFAHEFHDAHQNRR